MTAVLETTGLTKRYGKLTALDSLSLNVPQGSVFGLLGPNGSGKTTTLSIVMGAVHASAGSFKWFGEDNSHKHRLRIGCLLEKPNFLPNLNAVKNLTMVAEIKGRGFDKIDEVIAVVGLQDRKSSPFKTYSLGMKQRLAIASVLLSDPEVLVLDEPTNGLDPQGIIEIRELIIELSRSGKTIILASHILDEVEKVCTHVAILKLGHLKRQGEVKGELADGFIIEVAANDMDHLGALLHETEGVQSLTLNDDLWTAVVDADYDLAGLNQLLVGKGVSPSHLRKSKPSLEQAFLAAIGEGK